MNANPRNAWKVCKETAAGLFGHHKSTVSMKMRKQNGNYCNNDLKNAEVSNHHFLKLYNNHKGTKYDETILNVTDTQPEDPLLGNKPKTKKFKKLLPRYYMKKVPV